MLGEDITKITSRINDGVMDLEMNISIKTKDQIYKYCDSMIEAFGDLKKRCRECVPCNDPYIDKRCEEFMKGLVED